VSERPAAGSQDGPRYPVYVPKQNRTWWLKTGPYRRFAAREITSMFGAAFSVLMLMFLFALSRGPQEYQGLLNWLRLPAVIAASALILVAVLYHTGTWFRLTTHIIVIRIGRWVLPRRALVAILVLVWLAASAAIAYFHIWFWR
jgi:fumarate reductase subunit C